MEPQWRGYQLIGDNMLFRFSEQVLEKPREVNKALVFIGLCISGVKTNDLLEKIKTERPPICDKVILMVGTNDLLQSTPSVLLRANLHNLIYHLCFKRKVRKLIILTIPPVPRVSNSLYHWKTLKEYNEHIRSFDNGKDIIVVDVYPHFIFDSKSYFAASPLSKFSSTPSSCSISVGRNFHSQGACAKDRKNFDEEWSCDQKKSDLQVASLSKSAIFESQRKDTSSILKFSSSKEFHNGRKSTEEEDDLDPDSQYDCYSEEIKMEYFEVCFQNKLTRPDNVHLNYEGLKLMGVLVREAINLI